MNNYQHILFDLDGTLTDPQEGIINSVQHALKRWNIKKENHELLYFIGPPLHKSFEEILGSEKEAFKAVDVYREYYSVKGIFENKLYEGIPELLEALNKNNKTLHVATSKPTLFAEQILHHFNIHHHFKTIIGSNMDGSRTEKNEIIHEIIKQYPKSSPKEFIMLGDRKYDIIGARYHNIASIALTFGYGTKEELKSEKPTFIAHKVSDLYALLIK
ncbi:MAG: HAD hydrolase-like protein [Bacteroidia bacterium]